jgi:tetratricopeptide (TPR) repeat protein
MSNTTIDQKKFWGIRLELWICLFLVLATITIYWQVRHHDFTDFDDRTYVSANQHVSMGITKKSMKWSFSFENKDKTYWHPLTWISHMVDVELHGMNPRGHHLTNVIFHIVNTLLLFLVLRHMTGALWKSALVASLFALHPLNVESVAWVAQRKNVLSTFFWMLTMLTYIRYTQRPNPGRYGWVVIAFGLGLLSKPMLVTLPFVLLLLDYWPLKRFGFDRQENVPLAAYFMLSLSNFKESVALRLILEKIPLLVFSALTIYLSSSALQHHGSVIPLEDVSLKLRVANALVSYIRYLYKALWPQNLAFFYPYPTSVPLWEILGALLLLMGVSIMVIRLLKSQPYLAVGWFWYLGTLVPVIGIMQAGLWPAIADRWAYIPLIGIYIMVAWGASALLAKWPYRKPGLAVIFVAVIVVSMTISHRQIRYWSNSLTLCQHALEVTAKNFLTLYAMGFALADQGRMTEAVNHYSESLRLNPNYADTHYNMGIALVALKNDQEAAKHYREVLRIDPDDVQAYNNLGNTLFRRGMIDKAIHHYLSALRIKPDFVLARNNLAAALIRQGKIEEAIHHYREALRYKPEDIGTQKDLKTALALLRKKGQGTVSSQTP